MFATSAVQVAADGWLTAYNDECRPHDSLDSVPAAVFNHRVFNQETFTFMLST